MNSDVADVPCLEPPDSGHRDVANSEFPLYILNGPDVDKGWAWIALGASVSIMVIEGLCMPLVGFLYIYHLEAFNKDPSLTACIGSLLVALMSILGPVAGWVCTRFGRRVSVIGGGVLVSFSLALSSQLYNFWLVFVTNGVLAGIGLGLVTAPTHINVGCYFVRRRTLASGICIAGFPIGLFLSSPLIQHLEFTYGWRGALLIFAGIQLNICVMGLIMQPSPIEVFTAQKATSVTVGEKTTEDMGDYQKIKAPSVYKNLSFYFLAGSFVFTNFSINIVYVHLPRYVYLKGASDSDVSMLYLALGITGVISKVLTGVGTGEVKNGSSINKLSILFGSFSIVGVSLLIFPPLAHEQSYRLLCLIFVGLYYNVAPAMYVPISVEIAGFSNLNSALGLIFLGIGVGYFTGPPTAAYIAEVTQDYSNSFYTAGAVNLLAAVSLIIMVLLKPPPSPPSDGRMTIDEEAVEMENL